MTAWKTRRSGVFEVDGERVPGSGSAAVLAGVVVSVEGGEPESLPCGGGAAGVVALLVASVVVGDLAFGAEAGLRRDLDANPSGTQTVRNLKNGRATVNVTTATPTVTPQEAGCPNKNWRTAISDVIFTSYTLTISQGGTVLFTCSGTFSGGSEDGDTSTPAC